MRWLNDPLLDGFEYARIGLPHAAKAVGDPDGLLTASVVRRGEPRHALRPRLVGLLLPSSSS